PAPPSSSEPRSSGGITPAGKATTNAMCVKTASLCVAVVASTSASRWGDLRRTNEDSDTEDGYHHGSGGEGVQEIYIMHKDTAFEIYHISVAEGFTFFKRAFPALEHLTSVKQERLFKDFIAKFSMIDGYH
ncbi:hypothetical protein PFISCL1PPCAC_4275, partial [Pristionchus fissidentatus]